VSRMEASEKRRIVEALILSSSEPISAVKLAEIIPYCKPGQAKDLVNELNTEYAEQDRAFEIWEVAGGYQLRTRAEFSGYLQKLQKERALRLSQAALETLAIIAYRQPVTRAEIEDVRGVDAGAVVKTLLERHLIRIAGQREVPGRPMLYGTSRRFLEVFGLDDLKGLPTLRELDELAREQGLLEPETSELSEVIEEGDVAAGVEPSDGDPEGPTAALPEDSSEDEDVAGYDASADATFEEEDYDSIDESTAEPGEGALGDRDDHAEDALDPEAASFEAEASADEDPLTS
jgi:segregation and condensation protein B